MAQDAFGLYDPRFERDACGVGIAANISGQKSHAILEDGLRILGQPGSSRRLWLRPGHGGRRGCAATDTARVPGTGVRRAGHIPPRAGRIRRGHGLPSAGLPAAPGVRGHRGKGRCGGGSATSGMEGCPRGRLGGRVHCAGIAALHSSGLHSARASGSGRGPV